MRWCSRSAHVSRPDTTAKPQLTIEQTYSRSAWIEQKQSRLFFNGTLQLWDPQHGWPMQIPSVTTTEHLRSTMNSHYNASSVQGSSVLTSTIRTIEPPCTFITEMCDLGLTLDAHALVAHLYKLGEAVLLITSVFDHKIFMPFRHIFE